MKQSALRIWILLMALAILVAACGNEREVARTTGTPVTLDPVEIREMAIPIHTSGKLFPKAQVKLAFKTGGIIRNIYVNEGSTVKQGQVLATLDLSEVQAMYQQARNGFLKAERDLKRVKNLHRDRAATLEQLENATTAFEVAQANEKIAGFNLAHSKIAAPADGRILKQLMEVNEIVGVGIPVFVFGSTENHWVVQAGVSERDVVHLRIGDAAEVRFDSYPGRVFQAAVSEISAAMDPRSGTFGVELAVDPQGVVLMAGFVAKVDVIPSRKETFILVPIEALTDSEGSHAYVFVPNGERAEKRQVEVVHILGRHAAVGSGLEGVQWVITEGAAYLYDGAAIRVVGE
jgi:RND family efflux transporter MFP subunit